MTILCLTGWQQRKDELSAIMPMEATHFDYASYSDVQIMFRSLPPRPTLAIGWSLGGQLLVRAIAGGYIKPKALLILGAPFQCVADEVFPHGMPSTGFKEFRESYSNKPSETLAQFNALIGLGDSRASCVGRALNKYPVIWDNGLYWLDDLGGFSCNSLNFSLLPPTIIVHGQNDKVIDAANAKILKEKIPAAQFLLWPNCGHATHLHNPDTLRDMINKYV